MGENQSARVDVGTLLDAAARCDAVADLVDGLARGGLDRLSFGGTVAGRDHAARGDDVRRAVDEVVGQTRVWARAMREIASAIRVSADGYLDVDARGAARLG